MLATLPLPSGNANPEEAVKVYFEVCNGYPTEDIELAVRQFIEGTVPKFNPAFAPTAAQLVTQIRANREHKANLNRFDAAAREQLIEREVDEAWMASRTPESKARVKAIVEEVKAKQKEKTPEEIAFTKDMAARTDQLFEDQFIDTGSATVSRYLANKMGYVTGNDDGEN